MTARRTACPRAGLLCAFAAQLGLSSMAPGVAAGQARLTVESIFGDGAFSARTEPIRWSADPSFYTVAVRDSTAGRSIYRVGAVTGRRELLLASRDLIVPGAASPLAIDDYALSPDGSSILVFTGAVAVHHHRQGRYYVWDRARRTVTAIGPGGDGQAFGKFSPDGRYVGLVQGNDIYLWDLVRGSGRFLTTDGSADILNGRTDWVYEEEFFFSDAFRFSPDSRTIAFWRMDQSAIPSYYMLDPRPLYPALVPVRYPKVGTANSLVRLGVIDLTNGDVRWIDLGPTEDIYVPAMDFAGSSDEVWFTRFNRRQNRNELLLADIGTGRSWVVMTDSSATWVEPRSPLWLAGGRAFLYRSERDGFDQVFHYRRDGSLIGKVTRGPWDVFEVYGVDERTRSVYFTAAADGPIGRPLYRIGLDGTGFRRITGDSGTHRISMNADRTLYVDEYSRFAVPPTQTLRRVDGTLVRRIADNRGLAREASAAGIRPPEYVRVPGVDGELNAYVLRPEGFDPSRRYPLLLYVYGGPGSQTVRDRWDSGRMPWHQSLTRAGYIVASVDGRGTGGRGAPFRKSIYLEMGWKEAADQIAAARYFASLPYVDPARIGIWGWSYGGFVSLLAAMTGEDLFKAAISVASVSDQRYYDTIYTERYMRTPAENPDGYAKVAPLTYADRLQGRLLVVHGIWDDNVHFQNALLLVDRLAAANRRFDMRFYPFKSHGIPGGTTRVNLFRAMTEWLRRNL